MGLSQRLYAESRVLSSVKHERGGVCQSVDLVIVGELSYGQPFVPVVLTLVHEELKELFDFLINLLCFAIGLGVVGGQGSHFDP